MTTKSAAKALTREVVRTLREGNPEANTGLNGASRNLVTAMAEEHGEVWLGLVNLHGDDRGKSDKAMWKWDGETVLNFSANFVIPAFDAELLRLIMERESAPYTGTKNDSVRVAAIQERIAAIGGHSLMWS